MADRLDVVVFGATGFTGKYAVRSVHNMAKTSDKPITWGIAGRNEEKLKEVLEYCKEKTGDDVSSIKIIICDVKDQDSLKKMSAQAKVIVNCCGPYRFYGEPVIKACVETSTHHVDVSGEPQYMERMQLEYHKAAMEKGIYIVSACGFDSIPTDLGVVFVQQKFEGTVNSIETFIDANPKYVDNGASIHYGTWESAVYGLAHANELRPLRSKLFPERLPSFKPKLEMNSMPHKSELLNNKWVLPFPGSDKPVVQRSQRFFYETDKKRPVQMAAYFTLPSLMAVVAVAFFGLVFAVLARFKLGRSLLLKYPGIFSGGKVSHEGPSEKFCNNLDFFITFIAKGWNKGEQMAEPSDQFTDPPNKTVVARVSGTDPGYGSTADMLVLTGLTILNESEKMPNNGGVYPPAAAFYKTSFLEQLQKKEILKFEILSTKES